MKKVLSLIIAYAIIASGLCVGAVEYGEEYKNMPAKTYSQKFSDVPKSYWAFSYIGEMFDRGVINGYPDGKFRPDNQVDRAEFAKIMVGAAGLKVENNYVSSFRDVSIYDWYAPYVECAKDYLTGYYVVDDPDVKFYYPETPALREDIATALVLLKGYDTSTADLSILDMFADVQSISTNAQKYVAVAVERGLVSGYEDGTFRGQDTITRAEAATMLWRAFQYGNDNKAASVDLDNNTGSDEEDEITESTKTEIVDEEENKTEIPKDDNSDIKTESKAEEEEKKPYVIKKLASAQLKDSTADMTMDNGGNIYFLDSDDCVYKLNTSTGDKSRLFNPSKLSIEKVEEQETEITEEVTETVETGEFKEVTEEVEETIIDEETGEEITVTKEVTKQVPITEEITKEVTKTVTEEVVVAEYTDYVPVQVFYDDVNGRVLLSGYYKSIEEAFKSPVKDGHYNAIYDITGGKSELVSEGIWDSDDIVFQVTLNDTIYRICDGGYHYDMNIDTGKYVFAGSRYADNDIFLKHGSDLYKVRYGNRYSNCISIYDFNNSQYKTISDGLSYSAFGGKDDCFYFRKSDGSMYKISVKTGKTTTLDVNFTENVEFSDLGKIGDTWNRFFVIDDNTFVFYDDTMSAFRKLSKNK